jgi:hypothetical protein
MLIHYTRLLRTRLDFSFFLLLILTIFSVAAIARPDQNMAGLRRNQGQVRPHGQPEAHRDGNN